MERKSASVDDQPIRRAERLIEFATLQIRPDEDRSIDRTDVYARSGHRPTAGIVFCCADAVCRRPVRADAHGLATAGRLATIENIGDLAWFGAAAFQILAPLQLAVAMPFSALLVASAVALEKDRKTLDLLLLTNLSNSELSWEAAGRHVVGDRGGRGERCRC